MTNDYENVTEKEVTEFGENTVIGIGNFAKLMKENKLTIAKQIKEIEELKKRIAELEKVESDSNNEHSTCLAEIERLNKALKNVNNENKDLSKLLEKAKTETEKAESLNNELNEKYKELEEENKKLERQNMSYTLKENQYLGVIAQIKLLNNQEKTILDTVSTEA